MELWAILAWVGTILISVTGTWFAARYSSKAAIKNADVSQWKELTQALQSELKRASDKSANHERRINELEGELEKWGRDYREMDKLNANLSQTIRALEADKLEEQTRHRGIIRQLQQELKIEKTLNASFTRTVEEHRLLVDHYGRNHLKLLALLKERCGMEKEEVELYLKGEWK